MSGSAVVDPARVVVVVGPTSSWRLGAVVGASVGVVASGGTVVSGGSSRTGASVGSGAVTEGSGTDGLGASCAPARSVRVDAARRPTARTAATAGRRVRLTLNTSAETVGGLEGSAE